MAFKTTSGAKSTKNNNLQATYDFNASILDEWDVYFVHDNPPPP